MLHLFHFIVIINNEAFILSYCLTFFLVDYLSQFVVQVDTYEEAFRYPVLKSLCDLHTVLQNDLQTFDYLTPYRFRFFEKFSFLQKIHKRLLQHISQNIFGTLSDWKSGENFQGLF